jgi:hypothetical protein
MSYTNTALEEAAPQSMAASAAKSNQKIFRYLFDIALCLTVLAAFVPLAPSMPAAGLDSSWMYAMNQGVAQGFVFGKDIVFTFGPYASIYTEVYHPATDTLMVCGSLFLGISYFLLLLLLGKGQKIYALLLYGIFLSCLVDSRDALLFSYPLLMALVVYRMTLPEDHALHLPLAKPFKYGCLILTAPFGLLPLVKGSLLPVCTIIAVLCFAIFWFHDSKVLACMALGIPAISLVVLSRIAGQPISALPGFFWNMRQIISGYAEAMSFPGNVWECVLYGLACMLIVLVIARSAPGTKHSSWFLCASYAVYFFIAFKAGFVRHDPWHNVIAGTSLLAAALLLFFVLEAKPSLPPLAMAILVWAYIGHGVVPSTANDISRNLRSTFGQAFRGAQERLRMNGGLQKEFNASLAAIRTQFPVPRLTGTTDIYSFNQSWLLASGNVWAPRPVTQSYSAYSPELAELNLRHLQGVSAPDNILFRVEPIDGRVPSLEDGLSWPALINGYSVRMLEGQTAYLRKRATDNQDAGKMAVTVYEANEVLGEEVTLPESNDLLFANIDIEPTLLGKIVSSLFKLPELHATMRLRNGTIKVYRAPSNMMKTDFLITPLVKNTEEFVLLAAAGNKYLANNDVKSITLSSGDRRGLFWNKTYSLRARKLNLLKDTDAENSLLFDGMNAAVPVSPSTTSTQACQGSISDVNGAPSGPETAMVGKALSVQGWMTVSGKDGIVPDLVYVTLTSEAGKIVYIKTHRTPRDDVRRYFGQPGMPEPGYATLTDVSTLSGPYTLGLARIYQGNLRICKEFKLPIVISH